MVAATLAQNVLHNGWMSHMGPSVNLLGDTLVFDANQHYYELPPSPGPRIVVDYGPGICERFILDEHIRACAAGRPFFYIPVTRGPFSNRFALSYLMQVHGDDVVKAYMAQGTFLGQEDGMLAATTRLLTSPVCGRVDLILCSGLQMAVREELEAGIVNAFPLLRRGGALLIRSQKQRDPPESSTVDDMLEMAYRAEFSAPRLFHSVAGDLLIGKRTEVVSAILIKP